MKPLTANLKTLYQCRRIWLSHCILMMGILMLLVLNNIGLSLLFIYLYGLEIGSTTRESLSKPFAFCLSGHIKNAQKLLLLVWLAITIIYALLFFMGSEYNYALFAGSIGLISLSYWLGVVVIFPKARFVSGATMLIILLTLPSNPNVYEIIKHMPLTHVWAITFVSGILSYLIYRAVGSKDNARRLCAIPWLGLTVPSRAKQNRFKRERMRMNQGQTLDRASELAGSFFSERIRSNHNSMLLTHLWRQVYLMIGLLITYLRVILISVLCILITTCLLLIIPSPPETPQQTQEGYLTFIILASAMAGGIFYYNRFDIFLLIGRREHFRRGVVLLFAVILIVLGYMSASVLLSNLVSGSLLPIMFDSKSFLPPNWWTLLVVPIIMIPLFGGLVILFREGGIIIPMVSMIFIAVVASLCVVNAMENTPFVTDLLIILSTAVITWGFHLAVLYYNSMKRSLC